MAHGSKDEKHFILDHHIPLYTHEKARLSNVMSLSVCIRWLAVN